MKNSIKIIYPAGKKINRCSLHKCQNDLNKEFFLLAFEGIRNNLNYRLLILISQSYLISTYLGQNELSYQICYNAIML